MVTYSDMIQFVYSLLPLLVFVMRFSRENEDSRQLPRIVDDYL